MCSAEWGVGCEQGVCAGGGCEQGVGVSRGGV